MASLRDLFSCPVKQEATVGGEERGEGEKTEEKGRGGHPLWSTCNEPGSDKLAFTPQFTPEVE